MVTSRYGDKTPRSFFGRLFGVLWILLGVIVVTMFTATVTSALTHSASPEFTAALEGQEVNNDSKLTINDKMVFYTTFEAIQPNFCSLISSKNYLKKRRDRDC